MLLYLHTACTVINNFNSHTTTERCRLLYNSTVAIKLILPFWWKITLSVQNQYKII